MSIALSIAALVVAIGAVLISLRALKFQESQAETKVSIQVEHSVGASEPIMEGVQGPPRPTRYYYKLTISVVNDGGTTEYLRDLSVGWHPRSSVTVNLRRDQKLQPHGRIPVEVDAAEIPNVSAEGFIVIAVLASGRVITTPLQRLSAEVDEDVYIANQRAG